VFILLLVGTFVLAFLVSAAVAWAFAKPIEIVLNRFMRSEISAATSRYLRFAMVVAGVCAGTRIRPLEEYIAAPSAADKEAIRAKLTEELWALELYRSMASTLQIIVWLLLLFAILALVAWLVVRKKIQPKKLQAVEETPHLRHTKGHFTRMR
jgi:hypothetical protein